MVAKKLKDSGLTRAQIARDAGLSVAAIDAWISGARTPTPESIEKLAVGLERRAGELSELAGQLRDVAKPN